MLAILIFVCIKGEFKEILSIVTETKRFLGLAIVVVSQSIFYWQKVRI